MTSDHRRFEACDVSYILFSIYQYTLLKFLQFKCRQIKKNDNFLTKFSRKCQISKQIIVQTKTYRHVDFSFTGRRMSSCKLLIRGYTGLCYFSADTHYRSSVGTCKFCSLSIQRQPSLKCTHRTIDVIISCCDSASGKICNHAKRNHCHTQHSLASHVHKL